MKRRALLFLTAAILVLFAVYHARAQSNSMPSSEECPGAIYLPKEVSKRAQITSRYDVSYTEEARAHNAVGRVRVETVLCADGRATDVRIIERMGYGMDERVADAVRHFKFTPAEKDGKPVSQLPKFEWTFGDIASNGLPSKAAQGRLVEDVEIVGNRRLIKDDLLKLIKTRPGEPYNEAQVMKDFQTLMNLGYFNKLTSRVTMQAGAHGGAAVIFEVQELPIISEIRFKGLEDFAAEGVTEKRLRRALSRDDVKIFDGAVYDPVRVQIATQRIKAIFAARGVRVRVDVSIDEVSRTSLVLTLAIRRELIMDVDKRQNSAYGNIE